MRSIFLLAKFLLICHLPACIEASFLMRFWSPSSSPRTHPVVSDIEKQELAVEESFVILDNYVGHKTHTQKDLSPELSPVKVGNPDGEPRPESLPFAGLRSSLLPDALVDGHLFFKPHEDDP